MRRPGSTGASLLVFTFLVVHTACTGSAEGSTHSDKLASLCDAFKSQYNENSDNWRKQGGGIMGLKTLKKLEIRARAAEIEAAKKAAY